MARLKIQILVDNPASWILPFANELVERLKYCHECNLIHEASEVEEGDVLFLLSCESIISGELLRLNRHNIVVHESGLPLGRGWSPLTWQILDGANEIPVTLFEAAPEVDAGPVYLRGVLTFEGHELCEELRNAQGNETIRLCEQFIEEYPPGEGRRQEGEPTYYSRRTAKDSRLDPKASIEDQFELLRVVDNKRYPAYCDIRGHRYVIRIEKVGRVGDGER